MKKLSYYTNPEYNEIKTSLLSARQSEEGWLLELQDTIFYPEGGGQPSDKGSINGIPVLHVRKSEGKILHLCAQKPEGEVLELLLDRPYREHYCIQHTAQHLISSVLMKICGAATVSVHLGQEESTIEIDTDDLSDNELLKVENEVNKEIRSCRPVGALWVDSKKELEQYELRRGTEKTENIRLIQIEDLDVTPCGGLHTENTARLGLVKYAGQDKIRGRLRLKWKIGEPAYEDYRKRFAQLETMSSLLSVQPYDVADRLKELLDEKKEESRQNKVLMEKQAAYISHKLSMSLTHFPPLIIRKIEDCPSPLFKGIVKNLSAEHELSFLICAEDGDRLNWALHLPDHEQLGFDEFKTKCLSLIDGKGGGRGPLWQGSGSDPSASDAFLEGFRELVAL
ncbi:MULTISPECIES: alanyl-tRNA editing protein [unclassified Oceanispirochaeta]|uniref:alanyl-tRNA editing protein n=1 Tax=unclassified Oceanispirochaeta TaxID=2635722 RepID=UPI0011C075E2|nr:MULTISPECIES: alanyl-tRNA editing protein [unclassified Oceanispirochaeta]MBF9014440.1 alanyl-tRNA editing protein [Oceanispirochaeta sp. M2]NPD74994.1 alanyl-tRNA editing protein [Oceanispirochaeta sp. M1]